jgi:hypothetical protein
MQEALVDYGGLSQVSGLPERYLRDLAYKRKIPFIKLGHRTIRFQPSRVFEALSRFEVKEATARK